MVEKCYGDTDLPRLSGAGAWCGSLPKLSRLYRQHRRFASCQDILSQKKSIQFMTTEQPDHQYSIGWNYTPKSNVRGFVPVLCRHLCHCPEIPDGQCWILITNTSTWKGHGFSNDTVAFFEKLRKQFMADMPKKDLFIEKGK